MDRYQGIIFPNRAEDIRQEMFGAYRVFLDYWDTLSEQLRRKYEALALRRSTQALLIYGDQGTGKTLFADKLVSGHEQARDSIYKEPDANNLWHRVTGGKSLSKDLISLATQRTSIHHIENELDWVESARLWFNHNQSQHRIVVADNAERDYFLQSLAGLDNAQYLAIGKSPALMKKAAEQFVSLCRTEMRPALFIILTNSQEFAVEFSDAVNEQHRELVELAELPFPPDRDKETAIRVNVNRLNPISYWYCLDRAGPESKAAVHQAISGAATFPASFSAVDGAIARAERVGRRANCCVLTLIVLSALDDVQNATLDDFGDKREDRSWSSPLVKIEHFTENWAGECRIEERKAHLLESEWDLRVVTFANPVAASLIGDDRNRSIVKRLLEKLHKVLGAGAHSSTVEQHWDELEAIVNEFPQNYDADQMRSFWDKGATRNADYESSLKQMFPNYNNGADGFLTYRPDLTISPYKPCSVLDASKPDGPAINDAIRRKTHVFEFTAIKNFSRDNVTKYLIDKLPNYVNILEQ